MHSLDRYAPCKACGDLDGCHLWQVGGVEVVWDGDGIAKVSDRVSMRVKQDHTWHIYVDGVSRSNGWCDKPRDAKVVCIVAAKLVLELVKLEAWEKFEAKR